jgi:plastocyanin
VEKVAFGYGKRLRAAIAAAALAAAAALTLGFDQAAPAFGSGEAQTSVRVTVTVRNFAFQPKKLEIAKGTKVVFSNASESQHTATRAGVFNTRRIQPGTSKTVQFQQKGTFPYHCKIHPFMQGKIVVG